MTKLQKQKEFIRSEFSKIICEDLYGHFKHNNYRIKMKKNLFRFEKKVSDRWLRLTSVYYKDANTENINSFINHILKG